MNRLAQVIAYTKNLEAMRAFYADGVGLEMRNHYDTWVEFDTHGAHFALHSLEDDDREGLQLWFESENLVRDLSTLIGRGVRFDGDVVESGAGRFVKFWDPEDNLIALFEANAQAGPGLGPAIGEVILNCEEFHETVAFYRDKLGFDIMEHSEHWVQFDTGLTRLAVHARPSDVAHPRHADQPVAFTIETDDLNETARAVRERGLHFVTAPMTEDFGAYAELQDPDGWIVVLREHPEPETLEEVLAVAFDEDTPHQLAIRKPITKGTQAISQLVNKPGYKSKKRAVKKLAVKPRERAATNGVTAARGVMKPTGVRTKADAARDERRARPALGRLKKAKRKIAKERQTASAAASRKKPVKRAVSKRAGTKRGAPKRAASRTKR